MGSWGGGGGGGGGEEIRRKKKKKIKGPIKIKTINRMGNK